MNNFVKVCLELVDDDRFFRNAGTSLKEQDIKKYFELSRYEVKLSDHVHWQKKFDYLNLTKNFVDLKINAKDFVNQYSELFRTNQEFVKMLKKDLRDRSELDTFEPNPKSFGFTEWISELELGCDEFYPDFRPEDKLTFVFARDEENLRSFVAEIIPKIQPYCEE